MVTVRLTAVRDMVIQTDRDVMTEDNCLLDSRDSELINEVVYVC